MSSNEVKVKVSHMTKKFGDLLVLNDISFEVKKGEFLCVVGPTGCGKTTFLNCLTKLGVYQLTSGEILINNEPVDLQKHNVAYIFQEYSAFPWQTVEENVAYGLKIKKRPAAEIKQRVDEMLELVGRSYAMSNAAPGISYHADYVTDSVEDVLEDLLAGLD